MERSQPLVWSRPLWSTFAEVSLIESVSRVWRSSGTVGRSLRRERKRRTRLFWGLASSSVNMQAIKCVVVGDGCVRWFSFSVLPLDEWLGSFVRFFPSFVCFVGAEPWVKRACWSATRRTPSPENTSQPCKCKWGLLLLVTTLSSQREFPLRCLADDFVDRFFALGAKTLSFLSNEFGVYCTFVYILNKNV